MSVWAKGDGVSLVETTPEAVAAAPALLRALTDATERSADPAMPEVGEGAAWYLVRGVRETVGVAAVRRDHPRPHEATMTALAIAREARGRAWGTKALLAAERRLLAEGAHRLLVRVPRTNGRGLYFMLRAGFTPVPAEERPDDPGDVTWFARRRPVG